MYYIGIDIGGMSTKAALFDKAGTIYARDSFETKQDVDYKIFAKQLANLCESLLAKQGLVKKDLAGVGMAIPGSIDTENGIITYSNNIKFKEVPIVSEFNKYINVPTRIGNDANLAVLGEMYFGGAKNYKDIVLITIGTGIGTGIVANKKLILGQAGAGGEGGHTSLKIGDELCTCGRRGCWEAYASITALIRQTKELSEKNPNSLVSKIIKEGEKISGKTAFIAAKAKDATGEEIVKTFVSYIGEGLVNLVNIFRPEIVLIGGGLSNEGDYLMKQIEDYVNKYSYGAENKTYVLVKKAKLKNDAGVYGGLALFWD